MVVVLQNQLLRSSCAMETLVHIACASCALSFGL